MTDEDVEMKKRFSGQARPPADTAWASDHLGGGTLGPYIFSFRQPFPLWTFDPLSNRKREARNLSRPGEALARGRRVGRVISGRLDRTGLGWKARTDDDSAPCFHHFVAN